MSERGDTEHQPTIAIRHRCNENREMKRRALITGATGDTGRAAVSKSISRGLDVRAMVRTQDKRSAALEALGAKVVVGDFLPIDSILQAMEGVDRGVPRVPGHPRSD